MSEPITPEIPHENQKYLQTSEEYYPQWGGQVRIVVGIFLVIAGVYTLTLLNSVIQILAIAGIIAFILHRPLRMIHRFTHIPWVILVLLSYVLLITVIIILVLTVIPPIVNGVNSLLIALSAVYDNFVYRLGEYQTSDGLVEIAGVVIDFDPLFQQLKAIVIEADTIASDTPIAPNSIIADIQQLEAFLNQFVSVAGTITGFISALLTDVVNIVWTFLIALFISFLLLLDIPTEKSAILRHIPKSYQRETGILLSRIDNVWSGFLRGQVTIGIMLGLITGVQLTLMGIPNVVLLAIVTGTISLIPTIGGLIALIPLSIVPLLQGSTVYPDTPNFLIALLVVFINLVISQLIWNVLAPKILGDAVDIPLPFILIGIFIGAAVAGVLGAFLVAPVMGTARIIVLYILAKLSGVDPFPDPTRET